MFSKNLNSFFTNSLSLLAYFVIQTVYIKESQFDNPFSGEHKQLPDFFLINKF